MFRLIVLTAWVCTNAYFVYGQEPTTAEIKSKGIKSLVSTIKTEGSDDSSNTIVYYDANGYDTCEFENGSRRIYNVISYNDNQRPVKIIEYWSTGKLSSTAEFVYREDNSFTRTDIDADWGMKKVSEYDNKGRKIKLTIPDGSTIAYTYNAAGQLIKHYSIPKNGGVKTSTTYSYNSKGQLITTKTTGNFSDTSTYIYDANGLLVKISSVSKFNGELETRTITYQYNY